MTFITVKISGVVRNNELFDDSDSFDKWLYCTINTKKIEYIYDCQDGTSNMQMDSGDILNILLPFNILSNLIHNNN
jgi:hypothetical protein